MSGAVTPDHYVLKRDGRVRKAQVHAQPYAIVAVPEGGVRRSASWARGGRGAQGRRRRARRAGADRRRPRAAPRRPAGHRVGGAGRRDLRAPGPAGDGVTRARCCRGRGSGSPTSIPHARHLLRTEHWVARARPGARARRCGSPRCCTTSSARSRTPTRRGTPRATGTRRTTTAGTRTAAPTSRRDWLREQGAADAARRRGRAADPRARGRRLARGRPAAGRRLAVVPGDDGAARRRLGRTRARVARARGGEAAQLHRPDGARPGPRARARRAAGAALVEVDRAREGAPR